MPSKNRFEGHNKQTKFREISMTSNQLIGKGGQV